MKKILLLFAVFVCTFSYAQTNLFMYDYRSVPDDQMEAFQKNEAEFWSKVAQNLMKKKQITGWTMMSRVGGISSDANIYFYVGIGSYENLDNLGPNYNKAYQEVMATLDADAQTKMKERLKIERFSKMNVLLNRRSTVFEEGQDWNYLVHNYAKATNVGAFLDAQDKYFKPFFEEHIKAKTTKQVGWITARVLNPVGNYYNVNCYTADAYQKMSDIYNAWDSEITWPEEGMTEVSKTMDSGGFYKSVIWHKTLWLDSDGKFHTAWD